MITIKPKKGKKDKEAKIFTLTLMLLNEFYDIKINGEKFPPKE